MFLWAQSKVYMFDHPICQTFKTWESKRLYKKKLSFLLVNKSGSMSKKEWIL